MNRRDLLRVGSLPLFDLTLGRFLAGRATASEASSDRPRGRARACIVLFMWGGPAHQDTWDPKPNASDVYRGEFSTIATRVPGYRVCEHLPRLADRADKLAVIRSMTHNDVDHTSATHFLLTGRDRANRGAPIADDFPNYGAVLSSMGRGRGPLPPYVSMMPVVPNGAPRFVEQSHGQGAGWLGPLHNPMRIDSDASRPEYRVGDFSLVTDVPMTRANDRRTLVEAIDAQRRRGEFDAQSRAMGNHFNRAFSLLSSPEVTRAFDLSHEPAAVRERYGMNVHGQSVLQARRLVEAGVPLVTVFWPNDGITNVSVYWDTHSRNFIDLRTRLCPVTDQAFSALLDDLADRGMLDETLIVWTGEMGRTPRVGQSVVGGAGAGVDGRDHWAGVFTSVLAGGGIRGGVIHGSSDRFAAYPAESPTRPADLAATIYRCLGVPADYHLHDRLGRPHLLCDGEAIDAILA